MTADYINLRGKNFRVEVTIGAMERYLKLQGIDSLEGMENLTAQKFEDTYALIYSCLEEGANWDKKTMPFSLDELSMWMRPIDVQEFMAIFEKQSKAGTSQKKSKVQPRKIKRLIQSIFSWRRR